MNQERTIQQITLPGILYLLQTQEPRNGRKLPTAVTIEKLQEDTIQDYTLQLLIKDNTKRKSNENKIRLSAYLCVFQKLSVIESLVLRGTKLIAPTSLWKTVVTLSHEGHQGIV